MLFFLPLKDENPTRRFPIVTIILIALNALIYYYSLLFSEFGFEAFLLQWGVIPVEVIKFTEITPMIPSPIYLTPLTSMFLHGSLIHLAGNMLYLWIFGNNIEDYFGPVRFIIFYIISGLAAVFLFVLFAPGSEVPMVGASGAIAGILGAYLILFPKARVTALMWILFIIRMVKLPAKFILIFWFAYQLFMMVISTDGAGGVAWMAHVGGFAFGWLWLKWLRRGQTSSRPRSL